MGKSASTPTDNRNGATSGERSQPGRSQAQRPAQQPLTIQEVKALSGDTQTAAPKTPTHDDSGTTSRPFAARSLPRGAWLASVLALMAASAAAEIYRYRDASGSWVFSDRPPPQQLHTYPAQSTAPDEPRVRVESLPEARQTQPAPRASGASPPAGVAGAPEQPGTPHRGPPPAPPAGAEAALPAAPAAPGRLDTRLARHFEPVTAVASSSLAVVTVHSETGTGSGFFVTDDGLLLTNRHVVRPPSDWAAEERAALTALKEQLDAMEQRLSLPRDRFSDPSDYDRGKRLFRERSRDYRQAKRELEMKRNAALIQQAFEIQLKDGERLTADLVDVSERHDLALLRVSGYTTPFIRPTPSLRLYQTQRVFAIGSPLGIKDTVTAGTYTGRRQDMLVTDARILPGSSGGPLVTEDGAAVGINTWKATAEADGEARGFGVAIPIEAAFADFTDLRAWHETQRERLSVMP